MVKITRFIRGRVLRHHGLKEEDLWVSNGQIVSPQSSADETIDAQGFIIAPGYIDLQINGAYGVDFSSPPFHAFHEVLGKLPQFGVTAFLPTVITTSAQNYSQILHQLQPRKGGINGASIVGIHLEGPFINPDKGGAHDVRFIQSFYDEQAFNDIYGSLKGVKIVTMAPEIEGGLQLIDSLTNKGIAVSLGHTNATEEQVLQAIEKGARLVTHLFNAMRPFHHREPGLIGCALSDNDLFYTLIADGVHVHPSAIKMAWRANPNKLILMTDAISSLGIDSGSYTLAGRQVEVEEGKALIKGTNTLAGSIVSLDAAVRYFYEWTGCSRVQAIEAASLHPAQAIGLDHLKGHLGLGADADFNFLDDNLKVYRSYVGGELAFFAA